MFKTWRKKAWVGPYFKLFVKGDAAYNILSSCSCLWSQLY